MITDGGLPLQADDKETDGYIIPLPSLKARYISKTDMGSGNNWLILRSDTGLDLGR